MTSLETLAPRRRRAVVIVAAALAVLVIISIAIIALTHRSPSDAGPTPMPSDSPDTWTRPDDWSAHRPAVHLTPGQHWMNDPQKPFFLDGVWHFYYLYNADYPEGNGTAWYHATSTDLVHWEEHGVAIEKYANGLGDIWTGTAVVDHENTAGFGAGAVIALVTQQVDGVQRQSLFFSTDGGYTFDSYAGNPVMPNPGVADWRDPRVFWDDAAEHWVMALAEHQRIGFYTSPDLKNWTYTSDFTTENLGIIECPDLFPMAVNGNPDDVRWVLMAGANGFAEGKTTGTVYWTGSWDGESFTADAAEHRWLDHGADYYAAVTWDDPRTSEASQLESRYSLAWMNNWAYANRFPTTDWHGGSDTILRSIRLESDHAGVSLRSTPAQELQALEGTPERLADRDVEPGSVMELTQPASDAYRLTLDLRATDAAGRGEARIQIVHGDGTFATVGYDFATGTAFIARDADAIAPEMPDEYRAVRSAPVSTTDGQVRLDIVVDVASVEVFAGDGEAALTMATFGGDAASSVRVESVYGSIGLDDVTLTPLRVAPVERAE